MCRLGMTPPRAALIKHFPAVLSQLSVHCLCDKRCIDAIPCGHVVKVQHGGLKALPVLTLTSGRIVLS
jgi:hypothetical protein